MPFPGFPGGKFAGRNRRKRRRAKSEVTRRLEPFDEPLSGLLRAPVFGEPPRELLGRLLGPELGQLVGLLGEEPARLQLEERRDQDEELAARVEVELLAFGEPGHECDDDLGEVDVAQLELVAQDERQQQVERPLERVEVELQVVDREHHRRLTSLADALAE